MSTYANVAMLTRLRIEMPQMTKIDKKATKDAEDANNAHGAGAYRKDLYPKHLIEPIAQCAAAARGYMQSQTRPYGFTGYYALPNRRIMSYLDQMARHEVAFSQNVTAFLNNWSNVMLQAQATQGNMFDPTLYPDLTALRDQFIFEYPLVPIGKAGDIVLDELAEDVAAVVVAKARKDEADATSAVIKSAFEDLRTQVLRIIKQTTVTTATNKKGEAVEKSGKIYDTLTSDIAELTAVLADLNYGGNPYLAEVAEQIDMHLTIPADALRNDTEVCRITKAKAESILAEMERFI